jgi:hypothetical protein
MIVNDNVITRFSRGRLGDLIFRVVGDLSICSLAPDYSKMKWSKAQKDNRKRFRIASAHAKRELLDPEVREYYRKRAKPGQTANNVAISDFMLKPEIDDIDVKNYKGKEGNPIKVTVRHNLGVAAVIVMILNATGLEIESGMAIKMSATGDWVYMAKVKNPAFQGGRVVIRVSYPPGNMVSTFQQLDGT